MNYKDDDGRRYGNEGEGDLLEGSADGAIDAEDEDEAPEGLDKEEEEGYE